jgi:membrane protease YdiL (CAAX protease family)
VAAAAPRKAARKPAKASKKAARPAPKKQARPAPKKAAKRAAPARKAAPKRSPAKRTAAKKPARPRAQSPAAEAESPLPAQGDGGDGWIVVHADDADPWLQPREESWEVVDVAAPAAALPAQPSASPWGRAEPPSAAPAAPSGTTTGEWLTPVPPPEAPPAPAPPPEARRHGVGPTLWTILLGLDLAFLAVNAVFSIIAGMVLVFAPDSDTASRLRDTVRLDSPEALLTETLLTFALFGLIPLLWVLGTRQRPVEGAKRYLHLHTPGPAIARGVLLAIPLLIAVVVLGGIYTVATQGIDGLTDPDESVNPAVEGILDNLSWPLAVLVAVSAGVGEEIFFRGLLQRWRGVGLWGQAILFGLAHAAGGYPPQILFALGLGVFFGHLVRRGWSLWTLATAHALYDFTLLALGLATRSSGSG